jgi:hypothetical protein
MAASAAMYRRAHSDPTTSASPPLQHSLFFGPSAQGVRDTQVSEPAAAGTSPSCSPTTITTRSREERHTRYTSRGSSPSLRARALPAAMKSASQSQSPKTPSPRGGGGTAGAGAEHARSASEPWLAAAAAASASDDSCVNDVDTFARTVAAVKSKSASCARPDMLASVLSHYAAKWLPDVAPSASSPASSASGRFLPPESPTATWLKKRLLLESLVAALPPDPPAPGCSGAAAGDDGITCDFLLKLLRAGSMVGADAALLRDLEARAARRLDQATLGAVMIPAFGHAGGHAALLLDVPMVLRLVRGFLKEGAAASSSAASKASSAVGGGGAAAARVARLVDAYLAEAALEAGLRPAEFEELARAVPAHARPADDALYRAVDTYLKVRVRSLASPPLLSVPASSLIALHDHDSAPQHARVPPSAHPCSPERAKGLGDTVSVIAFQTTENRFQVHIANVSVLVHRNFAELHTCIAIYNRHILQ